MHALQAWREGEAMGVHEAAQRAGVHHEQWRRIENDKDHKPNAEVVAAIINISGLSLSDFING